jgi:alcohol dehydrogenase class IV
MRFDHVTPTHIIFGAGTIERAGEATAALGRRALVICGPSAHRASLVDPLRASLQAAGVETQISDGVRPDPTCDDVDAVIATARRCSCDVLIGLGGGSALDTAKAAAVGIAAGSVREMIGATVPDAVPTLPVLAIPTTTGSGAEVTKGAIVTDPARRLKSGIRGNAVFPKVAIVDPELARSLPPEVRAETAFDAFTHALESAIARRATPLTDALADRALALLAPALRRLALQEWDEDLREQLALAALLGGLNVASASTCLPHRMQQAMGSVPRVRVSHGRGLALVYPTWLKRVEPFARERLARIAQTFEAPDIHTAVVDLLHALDLDATMRSVGYREEDLSALMAGITGNVENDPIPGADAQLTGNLLERALLS